MSRFIERMGQPFHKEFYGDLTALWFSETAELNEEEGMARWIGPFPIYATKWQTISFTADEGACSYVFNGQETDAIAFDAVAADYVAAFEALTSVGTDNVTASGTAGNVHLVFDDSIEPTLITLGTNILEFESGQVDPDVFITETLVRAVELMTINAGDILLDIAIERVANFGEGTEMYFNSNAEDNGVGWPSDAFDMDDGANVLDSPFSGNLEHSGGETYGNSAFQAQAMMVGELSSAQLPVTCLVTNPIFAIFYSIGGTGHKTGIVKVYVCVATPAAP